MKRDEPRYRVRLFLSVDLVGSTAFKGKTPAIERDINRIDRGWVKQISHFYADFVRNFRSIYNNQARSIDAKYADYCPKVWKTLGDEIILCVKTVDICHLEICVKAFIRALQDYGHFLDEHCSSLDVKGSGWICPFPEPNVTVRINRDPSSDLVEGQLSDEQFEKNADESPNDFDFLGKHIDAGFRITRFARRDGMALSLELAFLLGKCCKKNTKSFDFEYLGTHELKGVISNKPYPIVLLDTERDPIRVRNRELELDLQNRIKPTGHKVFSFIEAFLEQERIEPPFLPDDFSSLNLNDLPISYKEYIAKWREDEAANTKSETTANSASREAETSVKSPMLSIDDLSAAMEAIIKSAAPHGT